MPLGVLLALTVPDILFLVSWWTKPITTDLLLISGRTLRGGVSTYFLSVVHPKQTSLTCYIICVDEMALVELYQLNMVKVKINFIKVKWQSVSRGGRELSHLCPEVQVLLALLYTFTNPT